MTSFSGVTFVLFCFVFRLYDFVEAGAFRSIALRYAGAPIATLVFVFVLDVAFSEYFLYQFRFLFVWTIEYIVRSFLPNGVFLACDHGLDF